jgi:septal ring factor EnvC (AmiA/AmiB activator)
MKTKRFMAVALTTALSAGALYGSLATADTLDTVLAVGQQKTAAAQASQKRIDKIAEETNGLLQQFKVVNKEIDGLRVYNRQLEKQLDNQLKVITELEESIGQVTIIERQIQPLILKMLDGLEQFIELDAPFKLAERKENLENVKNTMDRSDITVAEKFRQVLELYNFESEYARKIDSYGDTLSVGGQEREVNLLQIGRIALLAQTTDSKTSLAYDKDQKGWVEIDDGEYRRAIMQGLKIAKKQATTDIMNMPIPAPEAAQ